MKNIDTQTQTSTDAFFLVSDLETPSLPSFWEEMLEQDSEASSSPAAALKLSGNAQRELVLAHQSVLRLRQALVQDLVPSEHIPAAQRACERGETFTSYLMRSLSRLIHNEVGSLTKERLGGEHAREIQSEMLSVAHIAVLNAAISYRADKGMAFSSWAVRNIKQEITQALIEHTNAASLTQGQERVGRIAAAVRSDILTLEGRSLSSAELRDMVEGRCYVWAAEHLTDEQKLLSDDEQYTIMTNKLTKQGMLAACRNITFILQVMQRSLDLDAPLQGEGSDCLRDTVADQSSTEGSALDGDGEENYRRMLGAGLGNLQPREATMVMECLNIDSSKRRTFKEVAQEYGIESVSVRRMVKTAEVRLQAPHAQYAYMGDLLSGQFEPDMDDNEINGSAVGALKRRRRPQVDESALLAALEVSLATC